MTRIPGYKQMFSQKSFTVNMSGEVISVSLNCKQSNAHYVRTSTKLSQNNLQVTRNRLTLHTRTTLQSRYAAVRLSLYVKHSGHNFRIEQPREVTTFQKLRRHTDRVVSNDVKAKLTSNSATIFAWCLQC